MRISISMRALCAALAACVIALGAAGCSLPTDRYYTEFGQPGTLAEGAPVYNLGLPIGSVTSVSPASGGGASVAFDIYPSAAGAIRQDSIMVLQDDPTGPCLDVMTPNPSSAVASSGATIDGASNQSAANAIVAAKGLAAMAPGMAMMGAGGAAAANAVPSPASIALQQQIAALQMQYLAAGLSNATVAAQQLQSINSSAAALERQMIAAGNSAQARQLQRQVENLSRTLTTPPGTLPPPSAIGAPLPPGGSPSSTGGGGTLIIPPAH
ncbi:MAG TPA: MlaD family protein [Candidatus Binataceae bacterium]|nr:MlaD family protein [Candidatus Binataceae bacterium]